MKTKGVTSDTRQANRVVVFATGWQLEDGCDGDCSRLYQSGTQQHAQVNWGDGGTVELSDDSCYWDPNFLKAIAIFASFVDSERDMDSIIRDIGKLAARVARPEGEPRA